ncbi:hypothetical protein AgCh_032125 [Apium graveolens]
MKSKRDGFVLKSQRPWQPVDRKSHGRETANKLMGHDQLLVQTSDSFSGLLLFEIGFLLFMVAFVKDRNFQDQFGSILQRRLQDLEVCNLKKQLTEFVVERKGWLEEIDRK